MQVRYISVVYIVGEKITRIGLCYNNKCKKGTPDEGHMILVDLLIFFYKNNLFINEHAHIIDIQFVRLNIFES